MKTTIEVNGKETEVELDQLSKEEQEQYGIHMSDDEPKVKKSHTWNLHNTKVMRVLPFFVLIAFFLCGFLLDGWRWCWSFFLLIPLSHMLVGLFSKRIKTVAYIIFSLCVFAAIFLCGFLIEGGWHWSWCFIFAIPAFGILVE